MEEWLLPEDLGGGQKRIHGVKCYNAYHRCEHTSIAPHVKAVIVLLEVHKQLGTFEVARCHANIVCCPWMVELGQTPIDQTKLGARLETAQSDDVKTNLPPLVVYHYIVWFHVTVHYSLGVAIIQGLRGNETRGMWNRYTHTFSNSYM